MMLGIIDSYFTARFYFYNAKSFLAETIIDRLAHIRSLATKCGFSNELGTVMQDIFLTGLSKGGDGILEFIFICLSEVASFISVLFFFGCICLSF